MSKYEDFVEYKKRHEEQIRKSFMHVDGEKICSVYDIEKTITGILFTAEFNNGEVLRLFTHEAVDVEYRDKIVQVGNLKFSSEENRIVLEVGEFAKQTWWFIMVGYL